MIQGSTVAVRVAVIGAAHVDELATPEQALVPHASNPVSWSQRVGGVAANAACAAMRSANGTIGVEFVAAVGDDILARQLAETLRAQGLHAHLVTFNTQRTGRYCAVMDHDGELFIGLADVSLAEKLSAADANTVLALKGVAGVLMDANLSESCLMEIASQAGKKSQTVAALSVSPAKTQRLIAAAPHIHLLFCNRREAIAMCPHLSATSDLGTLADSLTKIGFSQLVITDGASPILVQDLHQRYSISTPLVPSTSTVNGAGDALAGASFAALSTGMSLPDAVRNHGIRQSEQIVRGLVKAPILDDQRD